MTKNKELNLSLTQVAHLVNGAIRNNIDLKTNKAKDGYRFFIIMECLDKDACISVDQDPETEEELIEIAVAHNVGGLYSFFESIITVTNEKEESYRAFETKPINKRNLAKFVRLLGDLDDYWAQIDDEMEKDEYVKTSGKNVVEGNDTVN